MKLLKTIYTSNKYSVYHKQEGWAMRNWKPFWSENRKMLEIWIIDLYWSKELTLAGMWINKDLGKWGNEALIRSRVLSKSILGNFLLYAFWPPPHHLSTILVHGARLICSKSNMWAQRPAPSLPGRYARPKRLS